MKDEEYVLCTPADPIRAWFHVNSFDVDGHYVGLRDRFDVGDHDVPAFLDAFVSARAGATFRRRGDVETDPNWKQVVAYATIRCGGQVLSYARPASSGEARLHKLTSIGFGGHLNPRDFDATRSIDERGVEAGAWRELVEEVALGVPVRSFLLMGVINHDLDPVGEVHVGLHYELTIGFPEAKGRAEVGSVAWEDDERLAHAARTRPELFEAWTRIVLRQP